MRRNHHDVIGAPYDIIGAQGAFDGAFNGQGYPTGLAFGADGADGVPSVVSEQGLVPPGYGPYGMQFATPNQNAVAALIAARNSTLVEPRLPQRSRREWLGFGQTCVGPCETVDIEASPQVCFKATGLVVPSPIAFNFLITQVKFGKWNLLANGGAVPAACFIETAENGTFNPDTVQQNGKITITVTNTSNADQVFSCAMPGWAIE